MRRISGLFGIVTLTLCLALAGCSITVPNVVGKTTVEAEMTIAFTLLKIGTVTQAYSATVASGVVISQTPAFGASASVGTTVDLTVSKGPQKYTLAYTAGANGAITGISPQTVSYGGSGTTVTAVPNQGYGFLQWSDGATQNPRTDIDVTGDVSVTAIFEIQYTLIYAAGANGTITGISPQTVSYGGSGTTVTAVPNTGYHFLQWSDGSTQNPRMDTDVTGGISVTANFASYLEGELFSDNFDHYAVGTNMDGQGGWADYWGGGISVSNTYSVSQPKSCKLDNNGSCWGSDLYHEVPYNPVVWFSGDIMAIRTGRSGCHDVDVNVGLWNPSAGAWGTPILQVEIRSAEASGAGPGLLVWTSSGPEVLESDYASLVNRWISVVAKLDEENHVADVWVDGVHKATYPVDPSGPTYTGIEISNGEGIGYVDNVRIFTTAPTMIPNVLERTQSEAQTAVTAAGFAVGAITQAHSATVPQGTALKWQCSRQVP